METAQPIEAERPIDRPVHPAVPAVPAPLPMKKSPLLAAILAGFPGVGHLYDGLYVRGVIFFSIVASLIALGGSENEEHPVLGFVTAFVWIFNVIDAVRQAQLINYGAARDLGLTDAPEAPKASQGGLLAGILLVVLGLVASLQVYFDVDLSWLLHFWPLGLIGVGAWLVVAWLRERKSWKEPEGESKLF